MSNPFKNLAPKKDKEPQHDEWSGQFSCQQTGCDGRATVAKYFPALKLLAWECPEGHRSRIEGMNE